LGGSARNTLRQSRPGAFSKGGFGAGMGPRAKAKAKDCLTFVWGRLRQPPEMSHRRRRRCQLHVSWPKGRGGLGPVRRCLRSPRGEYPPSRNATNLLHLPHRRVEEETRRRRSVWAEEALNAHKVSNCRKLRFAHPEKK